MRVSVKGVTATEERAIRKLAADHPRGMVGIFREMLHTHPSVRHAKTTISLHIAQQRRDDLTHQINTLTKRIERNKHYAKDFDGAYAPISRVFHAEAASLEEELAKATDDLATVTKRIFLLTAELNS